MHLDLSSCIPPTALALMESMLEQQHLSNNRILWHHFVVTVDTKNTSPLLLQGCAQVLASYGCVISAIVFGAYCSRHYKYHGVVLSDDVALYYLQKGILAVNANKAELLPWLTQSRAQFDKSFYEQDLWINACAAYLWHAIENGVGSNNPCSDFALTVVERAGLHHRFNL